MIVIPGEMSGEAVSCDFLEPGIMGHGRSKVGLVFVDGASHGYTFVKMIKEKTKLAVVKPYQQRKQRFISMQSKKERRASDWHITSQRGTGLDISCGMCSR